ncbi:uncharacterized protein PODANS_2_8070 [Podospora anserina S mat+]|uniref:Podospora anserina S mat+ genomic DNA chromosome 2, supercontig 2 n=1 Tax=Podospora anserina (strain S / ATCC MYA-4624 / DSM 980 / FGSC 10383) TaxID=515849 RepID=B2B6K6_PODAN|nr:uncharacterized protein PODANS_2_8070 [Podospora anserina S mat+]CAP73433.1 unnamed protein product [Podospora anserina S mat+]CDP25834.1 Putative protein of unknown function [Podospora anserina S mat+]
MASYHRVLEVFGRSIDQKSLECDYERWSGKVRLIGFVDSFFLICYSGVSRFEHGLLIYKEPTYFKFVSEKGGLDYNITTLGHPVGLTTQYPASSLKKYDIKLRKGRDIVMRKRIRRGVTQHNFFGLLHDSVRLGVVTQAELIGTIIGKTIGGSTFEDVAGKYLDALSGAKGSRNLALSGERT